MKSALPLLCTALALANTALSAPVGICLHAYSPEAPADKIECFEFAKVEQVANGYRFFLEPHGSTIVTKYRFRSVIHYNPNLMPDNLQFQQLLKQYEETARATPSTRRFLNPRIVNMRFMAAERSAEQQVRATLPKIEIGGNSYLEPSFKGIESGNLMLKHRDGTAKVDLDKISDTQLQALVKLDPQAARIKVLEIAKHRLWNPSFLGISSTTIKIKHEKGVLPLEMAKISDQDKTTIMSWSDGTWKIGKPGFYRPKSGTDAYDELILENGEFHANVRLTERNGESILVKTAKKNLQLPINQLARIPGLTTQDSAKIDAWAADIVDERMRRAKPEISTKFLSFDEAETPRVTDVHVKILQVLDEGVLASKFVGTLHKGIEKVQTTKSVTVEHPVSGEKISKVVDTSVNSHEVTEDVTDDLCYIVGNTSNLTDGEIVKAGSMRLLGRYQYTDVRGAQRSVRKYHVD
jgi:hypothetical protein